MVPTSDFDILNSPSADDLWSGIGGHFDNICQILCEFVDNSVSNFIKHDLDIRDVNIKIEETVENGPVLITISDTGTGIIHLDEAFTLGCRNASETPLNEHGFGLKHALASANPNNDDWKIMTRTSEDAQLGQYKVISSPYSLGSNFKGKIVNDAWKGEEETGTIVSFSCSRELLQTARKGIPGQAKNLENYCKYIAEDLGFIYAGVLSQANLSLTIISIDINNKKKKDSVHPIVPEWLDFYEPNGNNEIKKDLGGGEVKLNYKFGSIRESDYLKYYKRSMSTSGVEIRINGRIMAYNVFKDIWGIEKHNSYNYFLGQIDIISQNRNALPRTRSSKNGIREGDPKLNALYEWIKTIIPNPPKVINEDTHETELFDQLCKLKNLHGGGQVWASVQEYAYANLTHNPKIRIDLYYVDHDDITIYEGKRKKTEPKDVYQLLMYWDGLVADGKKPKTGVLIASEHPESVLDLIAQINKTTDANGCEYNLITKVWSDEGIEYPVLRTEADH